MNSIYNLKSQVTPQSSMRFRIVPRTLRFIKQNQLSLELFLLLLNSFFFLSLNIDFMFQTEIEYHSLFFFNKGSITKNLCQWPNKNCWVLPPQTAGKSAIFFPQIYKSEPISFHFDYHCCLIQFFMIFIPKRAGRVEWGRHSTNTACFLSSLTIQ